MNKHPDDPMVTAHIINHWLVSKNPIQTLWGEVQHKVRVLLHLNQNMKAAQQRLDHLNTKIQSIEATIAEVNPKQAGQRLDKLR